MAARYDVERLATGNCPSYPSWCGLVLVSKFLKPRRSGPSCIASVFAKWEKFSIENNSQWLQVPRYPSNCYRAASGYRRQKADSDRTRNRQPPAIEETRHFDQGRPWRALTMTAGDRQADGLTENPRSLGKRPGQCSTRCNGWRKASKTAQVFKERWPLVLAGRSGWP